MLCVYNHNFFGRVQSFHTSTNFFGDLNKIHWFDFPNLVKNNFTEKNFVVVKLDDEGTKFDLVRKMVDTGAEDFDFLIHELI